VPVSYGQWQYSSWFPVDAVGSVIPYSRDFRDFLWSSSTSWPSHDCL